MLPYQNNAARTVYSRWCVVPELTNVTSDFWPEIKNPAPSGDPFLPSGGMVITPIEEGIPLKSRTMDEHVRACWNSGGSYLLDAVILKLKLPSERIYNIHYLDDFLSLRDKYPLNDYDAIMKNYKEGHDDRSKKWFTLASQGIDYEKLAMDCDVIGINYKFPNVSCSSRENRPQFDRDIYDLNSLKHSTFIILNPSGIECFYNTEFTINSFINANVVWEIDENQKKVPHKIQEYSTDYIYLLNEMKRFCDINLDIEIPNTGDKYRQWLFDIRMYFDNFVREMLIHDCSDELNNVVEGSIGASNEERNETTIITNGYNTYIKSLYGKNTVAQSSPRLNVDNDMPF